MKKRMLFLLIVGLRFSLFAQPNITRLEYFIDADPGRGSGTSIIVSSPIIDQLENIATGSLVEGFHLLTVRAQDDNGNWSLSESKPFYVTQSTTLAPNNIEVMEYFIDADPGRGLGVAIPFGAAVTPLDIAGNVPTAALTEGFHLLTVRAQDDNGNWSLSESKPFYATQSTTLAPNNIGVMEYFIDADPGRGLGVAIPFGAAVTPLDIAGNVPTAALTEGFHLLTVRAQDDNGNWSLSESKPFYVTQSTTLATNNINAMEYYIDADPGRGLGVDIPITAATSLDILDNVPTALLSEGFHLLTVRARDDKGNWSLSESKPFYVTQSTTLAANNISAMEYYIDVDPGRGLGVDIPITAATSLDILENVPTALLSEGFHVLTVRAQDDNGNWSLSESKPFYVTQSTTLAPNNISAMEYYIDTDPGRGLGVDIPITAATSLDILENVPTALLSEGFHVLTVRAQDDKGNWSLSESKPFYVTQSTTLNPNSITALEYFIDADPGQGLGTTIPLTAAVNLDVLGNIPTSTLTTGMHMLSIRGLDEQGNWSFTESKPFFVDRGRRIINLEHAIDVDPGIGLATQNPILPGSDSIDIILNIPTTPLSLGAHNLIVRSQDENQFWSKTTIVPFTVCDGGTPDFTIDLVCQGSPTTFTDNSINVLPGDIYSWDFDGDAVVDASTQGDQSFTFPSSGTYNASLTINRAGCIGTVIVPVQVEMAVAAAAGIDQEICTNSTSLSANALGVNEVGQWQLVKGSATITSPNDPLSTLSDIASDTVELSWTITNSVAGCSAIDNIVIATSALLSPSMSATAVCFGTTTNFIDNSSNVLPGDVYSWDFDGDAITDATTQGDQSYSFTSAGTYNAVLSIDRGTCSITTTVTVEVFDAPLANAGIDQSVCNQSVSLSASPLAVNETGVWQVLNGTATIANLNDPFTTVTSITSGTAEFMWLVDNSITGCSNSDTVFISANQPIVANTLNPSVEIGDSIIIDLQSIATINAGDIITTSIITPPAMGVATLLTDGTVRYKPDLDATGTDAFDFRITNQCNNSSENTVSIIINNSPPVIDQPTIIPVVNNVVLVIDILIALSDPNNNIDFGSITIITQPSSGAVATVNANGVITIDYSGITFSGTDQIEIQVCDLSGVCVTQFITIPGVEVGGENPPITVFNGVSPDGDGYNDFLEIENIEFYPDNTVIILNRWGVQIEKFTGYNNQDIVFKNAELPTGTYYYHIIPGINDVEPVTGHFVLKIDN